MRPHLLAALLLALLAAFTASRPAAAQAPQLDPSLQIGWEVKNRFRLFRTERDFQLHVQAMRLGGSVLGAEILFARETDGRGWAAAMLPRLCVDGTGRTTETCERDGVRENYLAPADHRIGARLAGDAAPGSLCVWTFEDGDSAPQRFDLPCEQEVGLRVRAGRPTIATVDVIAPQGGTARRAVAEIFVRDLLVAGLGDSIAAGEGNPDRPVRLADEGFCFRRLITGGLSQYYRPGRADYRGNRACEIVPGTPSDFNAWARLGARWLSNPCHRSLYGYQVRAALALAVETPQAAVTFLPLACTGATIADGLFGPQSARELRCGNVSCPSSIPAQLSQLQAALQTARKSQPGRTVDLIFLTVGANDIDFSGLVADVIIDSSAERVLAQRGGVLSSVEDAQEALERRLPRDFARLRQALKTFVGGDLRRVVYVTYGNPALAPDGSPCPGGRDGFDVHPAFGVNAERVRRVAGFVSNRFLPRLKNLALCEGGVICNDLSTDRMTFADAHQPAFTAHGVCARSPADPPFDRACFASDGESFTADLAAAAQQPLACGEAVSEFRAYASRARWIRTANDSYFVAMTFPEGVAGAMRPNDLHDATWGILSAVYGGAIHPTAEGHAAMADSALAGAREALGLQPPAPVQAIAPIMPMR